MTDVLGVNPHDPHWSGGTGSGTAELEEALDALVTARLDARSAARAARDFAAADAIRDELAAAGVEVADTAGGAHWSLARRQTETTEGA